MTLQDIYTDIENLSMLENVDVEIIGLSAMGYPIYSVHVGQYNDRQIIIEASIHAREWVTSLLVVELAKYYASQNLDFGIYFIPIANPDGVKLVLEGVSWVEDVEKRNWLLSINSGSQDFSLWKANANAVDVNVNFDALWGTGSQNVTYPAPANYIGPYPNSEIETQTLIEFTKKRKPILTISYHTKGEVIYWGFEVLNEQELLRDGFIVEKLSQTTGYPPIKTSYSAGGYSDWVSLHLRVPAYTIEVGNDEIPHPIGIEQLPLIFEQNKNVPQVAYNALIEYEEI